MILGSNLDGATDRVGEQVEGGGCRIAIGIAELPLYGTLEWPVASQRVVENNLRLLQREGNGRSAPDAAYEKQYKT